MTNSCAWHLALGAWCLLLRSHRCSLVSHPAVLTTAVLLPVLRYRHSPFLIDEEFSKLISEARYVVVLRKEEGFEMLGVEALFSGTRPVVYEAMIETKPYRWAWGWGTSAQWLLLMMMWMHEDDDHHPAWPDGGVLLLRGCLMLSTAWTTVLS